MSLGFGNGIPNTIRILNPNVVDLRCDSIELLRDELPSYFGYVGFSVLHPDSGFWRPLGHPRMPDSSAGYRFGDRMIFEYPGIRLEFPKGRELQFAWTNYDLCPCKRSATQSAVDSLRFRMVFHTGSFKDTVQMLLARQLTVGIEADRSKKTSPQSQGKSLDRDFLGRHQTAPGNRPWHPRTWARRDR